VSEGNELIRRASLSVPIAKYVPDKTYTFCGTPMYIAPEVIKYGGHNKGADHWSWACLIYEMTTGNYAFYKKGEDELTLFKRICKGEFTVRGNMSFALKLLLISLFVPDNTRRLGSRANGWKEIFDSPWFAEIDFKDLRNQIMKAPWVPALKNPLDGSNFRDCSKLEDKMEANEPILSDEEQQIFKTFGPLTEAAF
jgi:protein kinase A